MNKKKGDQRGHNSLKGGEEGGGIGMQERGKLQMVSKSRIKDAESPLYFIRQILTVFSVNSLALCANLVCLSQV